jgi:hypothetical protein
VAAVAAPAVVAFSFSNNWYPFSFLDRGLML